MCTYCTMGDFPFRHNPPWDVPKDHPSYPYLPQPLNPGPIMPWNLQQLREYYELLKQVRDLEAQVGCPCEPNKADYVALFEERIKALEAEAERRKQSE